MKLNGQRLGSTRSKMPELHEDEYPHSRSGSLNVRYSTVFLNFEGTSYAQGVRDLHRVYSVSRAAFLLCF
jgi:hypothetical protein